MEPVLKEIGQLLRGRRREHRVICKKVPFSLHIEYERNTFLMASKGLSERAFGLGVKRPGFQSYLFH